MMVAALSAYPGDAFIDLLTPLDIAVIWPTGAAWVVGSAEAVKTRLVG